jgi:hypothetical protein
MEMQQMMERLLAEIRADRKAYQEKVDADRKAFKEKMDALIASIKFDRTETMACQYEMEVSIKKTEPNPEEKETAMEKQEIPNEEVTVHSLKECRSEKAASQENTEKTEPDPGKMQSVKEHQEIPKEGAAVMPVGGLRKRRRDRNLAAGRRQKPKERIQATCESRRRLNIAGKKMTRRATVARNNIFCFPCVFYCIFLS